LSADLLFELTIESLEALGVRRHLSSAARSVLRSLANLVQLVLRSRRVAIDLHLRRERLLQLLRTGRQCETGRQCHPEADPPRAPNDFSDHENESLLKISLHRARASD
jgi:hypothetical protein